MTDEATPKKRRGRKPNHSDSQANAQIDQRLAEAIKERTKLHSAVSRLYSAQERLSRVEQEINSLVQLQQRLSGQSAPSLPAPLTPESFMVPGTVTPSPFTNDIPPGIGSIPAGPRQPKPTTANAGPSVAKEGGFA